MYHIEGDGSYEHTVVWKDDVLVPYDSCEFLVTPDECIATVDGVVGSLDSIILTGIYTIIGQGSFTNTRILFMDLMLRGIQNMKGVITKGENPMLELGMVMLPNIVENP